MARDQWSAGLPGGDLVAHHLSKSQSVSFNLAHRTSSTRNNFAHCAIATSYAANSGDSAFIAICSTTSLSANSLSANSSPTIHCAAANCAVNDYAAATNTCDFIR